ncbi:signal peptidase [Salipiger aestuarii]|uniref:imelysin family protein n=1 Tax=Salipiger aestuarii TaxID=568098 RepID=UPI00025B63A4|nr:imelysin family protein [Salipiger aestuarii]EIE52622.1 putative signal peptide protein [Citreicella sp. 357]KAA8609492.1 signal peptidase [Salipiger aestuarii]
MRHLFLFATLFATPLSAGVPEALDEVILPGFSDFAEATKALSVAAQADCTPEAIEAPWNAAFDAWTQIGDIRIGPSETGALSVAFWPDTRGFTPRVLGNLIEARAEVGTDPEAFAEASIAARGLFALERMIYDADFNAYAPGSYACTLVRTITAELADQGAALDAGWDGFARVMLSAGEDGNTLYLAPEEATRALYTQLLGSLEFTADSRLGRPLGTFDRPRPTRAEAWRAGRPLRNVLLDADAAVAQARALAGFDLPQTDAALARLHAAADKIDDPSFQNVKDPAARLRVEILQQHVRALSDTIEAELGGALGLTAGFNSQDGD